MKKLVKLSVKALLLAALIVIPISGTVLADEGTIDMVVSPNVINLESKGGSISVHTDIGYVATAETTLEVNGVEAVGVWTFADNCGNLVVKCSLDTVKGMVVVGEDAAFTLTYNNGNGTYTGTDSVPIIQIFPQKP